MEGITIVMLCTLYVNVFSPVNETWSNLTVLHSILYQHRLSSRRWLASGLPERVHVFLRMHGFGEWFAGRVRSYAFKASFLLLALLKLPTLPLKFEIEKKKTSTCSTWILLIKCSSIKLRAFSWQFYPKWLILHSRYTVLAFSWK